MRIQEFIRIIRIKKTKYFEIISFPKKHLETNLKTSCLNLKCDNLTKEFFIPRNFLFAPFCIQIINLLFFSAKFWWIKVLKNISRESYANKFQILTQTSFSFLKFWFLLQCLDGFLWIWTPWSFTFTLVHFISSLRLFTSLVCESILILSLNIKENSNILGLRNGFSITKTFGRNFGFNL